MKAFQFRLEKVLKVRRFYEEQAKIELGRCIGESEKIKNVLRHIAEEQVSTRKSMSFQNFDLQNFVASENYLKNLDAKKEAFLTKLAEAELEVEKARKVYIAASQKRKTLSRLKEKEIEAWKKETQQEEAAVLDDLTNSATVRQRR